jgi:hypothetical protein
MESIQSLASGIFAFSGSDIGTEKIETWRKKSKAVRVSQKCLSNILQNSEKSLNVKFITSAFRLATNPEQPLSTLHLPDDPSQQSLVEHDEKYTKQLNSFCQEFLTFCSLSLC